MMADISAWLTALIGSINPLWWIAILIFMTSYHIDRVGRQQDRIIDLLFHIREVENGAQERREADEWWLKQEKERRRNRFTRLRLLLRSFRSPS